VDQTKTITPMRTIDARGKTCPVPLIMTKKGLAEAAPDETLVILLDNETSCGNVTRFLEDHAMVVHTQKEGLNITLTVHKTGTIPEQTNPASWCTPSPAGIGYMIAIQQNGMGQGDDDLGKLLIKGFINTLPDIDLKPQTLVFLNSGIFLALNDSPVVDALTKLEQTGVKILVCGTCLDFFQRKNELAVGVVSNMYDILEAMSKTGKVIYP
jgi:selenium metabolism protein YedF